MIEEAAKPRNLANRSYQVVKQWLSSPVVRLTLAGILFFFGFRYFISGVPVLGWALFCDFLAIVAISAGFAFLLALDQKAPVSIDHERTLSNGDDTKSPVVRHRAVRQSWAGLSEALLFRRPWLVVIILIGVFISVVVSYSIYRSVFQTELHGESGTIVIKLPGQTVYYYPIDPYGWQNTEIYLNKGDSFKVKITGRVSLGHLRHNTYRELYDEKAKSDPKEKMFTDELLEQLEDHARLDEYPFRGPNGYTEDDRSILKRDVIAEKMEKSNTIRGLKRIAVGGVIVERDEPACDREPRMQPCTGSPDGPGYDYPDRRLYVLSALPDRSDNGSYKARESGYLWVTINDVDSRRWDNAGFFILKLTTSR